MALSTQGASRRGKFAARKLTIDTAGQQAGAIGYAAHIPPARQVGQCENVLLQLDHQSPADGIGGLALVKEHTLCAVLCDIEIQGPDGVKFAELVHHLKRLRVDVDCDHCLRQSTPGGGLGSRYSMRSSKCHLRY